MRGLRIVTHGSALGNTIKHFDDNTRYWHTGDFAELMADAVRNSGVDLSTIDLMIGAVATPLQPLPCSASTVANRLGITVPTMDVNTSCSSFITAMDVAAHLLALDTYRRILIVTGDDVLPGLNPDDKKTYELFSSSATAFVVEKANDKGILYHKMVSYPEYMHDTEIAGGGSACHASKYAENPLPFYFAMQSEQVLKHVLKTLPDFMDSCFRDLRKDNVTLDDFKVVIPHQASRALPMIMRKLKIKNYVNRVKEYGNMVSSGVPYVLCKIIDEGGLVEGDKVLLLCTAAGLTYNFMALQL